MPSRILHCRRRVWPIGLIAVVVALVSQIALGAMVLPDEAPAGPRAALAAVSVMCGHRAGGHDGPAPHRRAADPALCPLSLALALPSVVPLSPAIVPLPRTCAVPRPRERPAARAPPSPALRPGAPRGPPVLI